MGKKLKDQIEIGLKEVIILTTLIITSAMIANASTNILNSGPSDKLVAEYRLDTGTGKTAYDTSGNNDGTINGASWTEGVKGKALSFDGNDDYLASEYSVAGSDAYPEGLTVSSWVYREDGGTGSRTRIVSTDASEYWSLDQDSGTGNGDNSVSAYVNVDGSTYFLDSQDSLPLNRWSHVVLTWDPETTQMKLYRDGEEVASRTTGSNLGSGTTRYLTIGDGSEAGSFDGGRNNAYFGGKVDSTRIYEEDLNLSQIRSMYNSGAWRIGSKTEGDDPSKVLDMSFQHQNSSHVLDTSGYNNHGQPQNGASQEDAVNCKVGRCYSFDGNDDHVKVNKNVISAGKDEISVSAWIYVRGNAGNSWERYVDVQDGSNNGRAVLYWDDDDQTYGFSGLGGDASITGDNPPKRKWVHWAGSVNGTHAKFYMDGELMATDTISSTTQESVVSIGKRYDANDHALARIDQVKVFNRSLSQQEIVEKTEGLESDGTVLDMRFDSEGGNHVEDYSGEGNHGSLVPNESYGPERIKGLRENALEFDPEDGDSVYVSTGSELSSAIGGGSSFTVSAWVKPEDLGTRRFVVTKRHRLLYVESDNSFSVRLWDEGGSNHWIHSDKPLPDDKYSHISLSVTSDKVKLFVNGNLEKEISKSWTVNENGHNVQVSGASWDSGFRNFKGSIDSVTIKPYAINEEDAEQVYRKGKSLIGSSTSSSSTSLQDGLVLSQTFNRIETCGHSDTISCPSGMSGEVVVDESGEANHGELVNGPEVEEARNCMVGGCLGFDGSDDQVNVGNEDSLDLKTPFVISTWVKPDTVSDGGQILLDKEPGGWGGIDEGYAFQIVDDSLRALWGNGTTLGRGITADNVISKDEWQQVAWKMTDSKAYLFVNGEKVAEKSNDVTNLSNSNSLTIGRHGCAGCSNPLNGTIDQVRVYNRSLSDQEIWKLYTRGRDRETGMGSPVGWWRFDSETYDATGEANHGNNENGIRKAYVSGNLNFHANQWNGGENNGEFDITCPGGDSSCWFEDANGNHSSLTINNGVACQDVASGTGYIMYSSESVHTRFSSNDPHQDNAENFICVRHNNGWEYDTNNNWIDFKTVENDTLVASVDFDGDTVSKLTYYPKPVNGKVGEALKFDGSEDLVSVPDSSQLDIGSSDATITFWLKTKESPDNYDNIVMKSSASGVGRPGYLVNLHPSGSIVANIDDGSSKVEETGDITVNDGSWNFITVKYDRDEYMEIFVNGEKDGEWSISGIGNADTSEPLRIGDNPNWGSDRAIDGKIDDVRIYPYALNQDQVKQVMNGGSASIG